MQPECVLDFLSAWPRRYSWKCSSHQRDAPRSRPDPVHRHVAHAAPCRINFTCVNGNGQPLGTAGQTATLINPINKVV